jgi:hypothetical protein
MGAPEQETKQSIRSRKMRVSRVLIGLVIACSAASAAPRKSVYRNKQYGIYLHIPRGAWLCPYVGGSDHGPGFLLGSEDASFCRGDSRQRRGIVIFGEYDLGEETDTPRTFLGWLCANDPIDWPDPGAACSPAPADLSVNGLPSRAARINHSNGTIEIIVVTQAGAPDPNFDAAVPSFNYDMRLDTDASHLDADLAVFRAVLKALKIAPPPSAVKRQGPTDAK